MSQTVEINPENYDSLIELMDAYADTEDALTGVNEHGEYVMASIFSDKIVLRTCQANGWIRINIYWRDGAADEMFTK